MALRERDKKGYPQFVGRIIEWKYSRWEKGKIQLVRVAGFDYHVGITLVNVYDNKDNYTCYNGPLSPNRKNGTAETIPIYMYDKAFGQILKVMRTNSLLDIDIVQQISGESKGSGGGSLVACAFGQ